MTATYTEKEFESCVARIGHLEDELERQKFLTCHYKKQAQILKDTLDKVLAMSDDAKEEL
jgi:hypothetical protein